MGGVAKKQTGPLIALTTIGLMTLLVIELSKDVGSSVTALIGGVIMAIVLLGLALLVSPRTEVPAYRTK